MRSLMTTLGKLILACLRVAGRKGTALPGLVIEKLYPRYLNAMLDQLPRGVILITGTNGKTTTTRVVTELLRGSGLRVLTNPTGSNFVRGTIAALVAAATPGGRLPYDIAVFEQDEAHAVLFVKRYQPVGVVALNVMRDQMDRFGEIDATARLIGQVVAYAKDWAVLNANDQRIAGLAKDVPRGYIHWFGHSRQLQQLFIDDDQLYSDKPTFYEAAAPDVLLEDVRDGQLTFRLKQPPKQYQVATALGGTHNAMNIVAAVATVQAVLGASFNAGQIAQRLPGIQPAFGRGEAVMLAPGKTLQLQLVKNPAGFRHVLRMASTPAYDVVGIAINDDYADGRDVSWLWDVDFTTLNGQKAAITTGGTRAADMAVRLKYDDVQVGKVEPNLANFLEAVQAGTQKSAVVFCTYTAMLALRQLLKRHDQRLHEEGL